MSAHISFRTEHMVAAGLRFTQQDNLKQVIRKMQTMLNDTWEKTIIGHFHGEPTKEQASKLSWVIQGETTSLAYDGAVLYQGRFEYSGPSLKYTITTP